MKMKKTIIAACLFAFGSMPVYADLINSDWEVGGDNLTTTDTVTGLTWLDLSAIGPNVSINDASTEFGLGGLYEGFRLATESEVVNLMSIAISSGFNGSGYQSGASFGELGAIQDLLGYVDGGYTLGFYQKDNGTTAKAGWYSGGYAYLDFGISSSLDRADQETAVFLVADTFSFGASESESESESLSVPVPAPAALLGLGLLGLYNSRRKKA